MNAVGPIVFAIVVGFLMGVFVNTRTFRNYSMRTKLIFTFAPVILVAIALLAYFYSQSTRAALTNAANQSLASAASETATRLDTFFVSNLKAMRTEAQLPDFVALLDPAYFRPNFGNQVDILQSLYRKDPEHIRSYALLNSNGLNIADTDSANFGKDEAQEEYFRVPLESGLPYISPVLFKEEGPSFYLSTPIFGVSDEVVGVLRVEYDASILQTIVLKSTGRAGTDSFAVLFDENHLHLAHGNETYAPQANYKLVASIANENRVAELKAMQRLPDVPAEDLSTNLPELEASLENVDVSPFFTAQDIATGNKIDQVAVVRLESQPWTVAFFQPREVFLAPVLAQARRTILLTLVIGALALVAAVWFGRTLTVPIIQLTDAAQQAAEGNLKVQAPVSSQDEIGVLAQTFNRLTAQLAQLVGTLENQVKARTSELALSMQVGQRAAAIREEDKLLPTITQFIRDKFNLYYVQVYYVDDVGQYLLLREGTGSIGQALLGRRHRLPVGAGSIVGQAAVTGRPVVVPDTETSTLHLPNPLLPETRSELAVPLLVEDHVIGVLDMQANRPNIFTEQNVTVFEAMATLLALSIDSARQWSTAQAAQQKAEKALSQLTREVWQGELGALTPEKGIGFTYNLSAVTPLQTAPRAATEISAKTLVVPLVVQNQTIGQLSLALPEDKAQTEDEEQVLRAVAERLAQKIENLRLFADTQRNAWRDHVVSETAAEVWSAAEVDAVMKAAVAQLGQKLQASEVVIRLGKDAEWSSPETPALRPQQSNRQSVQNEDG